MGVAFFLQTPPDLDLAHQYLTTARTMLDKVRQSMLQEGSTEPFPYEAQMTLVEEQLQLVQQAAAAGEGAAIAPASNMGAMAMGGMGGGMGGMGSMGGMGAAGEDDMDEGAFVMEE